jgi:hypothetical protein
MSQLGRISGQLLKDNLTRNGHDLTFDNDLLHLDVNNRRIGIKTVTPQHELDVNGTTRTTDLEVTNRIDISVDNVLTPTTGITISGNTITSNTGTLNLTNDTGNQVNYQAKLVVDSIELENNVISTNAGNLEIRPNGSGTVDVYANTNVYGDVHVTGNIQADGNITVGDANTDNITINADVASNIIPDADITYQLGNNGTGYVEGVEFALGDVVLTVSSSGTTVTLSIPAAGPSWVDTLTSNVIGKSYQIAIDGTPGVYSVNTVGVWSGTNPQIISVTNDGLVDGTYNVSSIRFDQKRWLDLWVKNIYTDAIVSGDITIDGIQLNTVQGKIYYVATNGSDTNAGQHQNDPFASVKHALSVAASEDTVYIFPGTYVEQFPLTVPVGVAVKGAGIRSVKIVPTVLTQNNDAFLLNGETTVEDLTVADFYAPGYAFKFASGFTVSSRSPYVRNITVLTKGSTITLSDPLGFASADAGGGAYIDGSLANAASKEASMLFHSVTFICPGVDVLVATNGARVEWLNSFTYYANKGMYLLSGSTGFAGDGKTRIKINTRTGTFAAGNTLTYYDTDGTTVLASGTIESVDGNFFVIDGKSAGWEIPEDRAGKTVSVNGDAKLNTAQKKFGTASLALDGTGDYLTVASQPDFSFGTGDFCIEAFVYPTTTGTYRTLFDLRSSAGDTGGIILGLSDINALYFYYNGNYRVGPVGSVPTNSWSHIALARVGGNTKAFINGVQVGSTYADTNNYATRPVRIGADPNGNFTFTGYVDEVRISKGVGRYPSDFTAPTTALLGDTSTVLLLHFNGVNNSTQIVDDGVTFQDIRTSAGGTASIIDVVDYSDFGAEVRSIGSAVVYGNYGIYGDGVGVIAYLIGQNLAYIGNGKETTNDPNTVIQANEVVELNNAKIFYNSVDHKGDFRIGDLFYVNQATGEVSFTNSNVTIGTSLTFDDGGGNITYLDATKIETGDFRISGNTVETLTQDFNVDSATNQINLQSNVTVTGNLDVTGDVTVGGNVTIGNEATDTVQFVAGVDSDILPALPSTYDLGTPTERWSTLYSTTLVNADIQISTNVITTTNSNLDLTLQANGSGRIYVPANNVEITNNLTVNGTTDVQDLNVTGTLTHVGDVTQTGNVTQTGDITLTGTFTTTGYGQFADIKIDNNSISTTIGTNDLILDAAGTGRVYVPDSDVEITQDLTVDGYIDVGSLNVDTTISSLTLTAGDIKLESNFITTLTGNNNLELRANGTGLIYVPLNNVQIDNNLTVLGTTNLATTNIGIVGTPATVTHVGAVTQTGDLIQTGDTEITGTLTVGSTVQFEDINIDNNVITTTIGNNDLVLEAAGTGKVIVPLDDAEVTGTLTVLGTTSTSTINNNTGTVTSGTFSTGNITISGNTIQTTVTNSNLQLQAAGTGFIELEQFDVQENELRINSGTDMTIAPNGTGIVNINSTQSIKLPVGDNAARPATPSSGMIRFNTELSRYEGYIGTAWTRLDGVEDSDGNTKITAELTPGANDNTIRFIANGTQVADLTSTRLNAINVDVGAINVNNNVISTTTTDTNLILSPNGTGSVRMGNFSVSSNTFVNTVNNSITLISQTGDGYVKINSTGGFVIPVGRTDQRPSIFELGMMRYNTSDERVEVWNGTAWVGVAQGASSGVTAEEATDISIVSAFIFG